MRPWPAAAILSAFAALTVGAHATPEGVLRVRDDRLELALVACDPDVVTPVGLAVDGKGRLFVLESHTHSPPRGYAGPKSDRIKVLAPPGDDGRCRVIGVFAEGLEDGLNLAF